MIASPHKSLRDIDANDLAMAMSDLGARIVELSTDPDPCELISLHRDLNTVVNLLWLDEQTQFTQNYSPTQRALLISAITSLSAVLEKLPSLPRHRS